MTTEIVHPYKTGTKRISISEFEKTRTKKQFAKECDINLIMKKFHKEGILTHLRKYGAQYGEATSNDLLEAMDTLTRAQTMYEDLPSEVRKNFAGPEEFVDFVSDPDNVEKLREWGLARTPEEQEAILVRVFCERVVRIVEAVDKSPHGHSLVWEVEWR